MSNLVIKSAVTACPDIMRFSCGKSWLPGGSIVFDDAQQAAKSPLIAELFALKELRSVAVCEDCVTVTKISSVSWETLKPEVLLIIAANFHAPLFPEGISNLDNESKLACTVRNLIDTKVKPFVHNDGGEVKFLGCTQDDEGVSVHLHLSQMCCGCAFATQLQQNITRLLQHYTGQMLHVVIHQ